MTLIPSCPLMEPEQISPFDLFLLHQTQSGKDFRFPWGSLLSLISEGSGSSSVGSGIQRGDGSGGFLNTGKTFPLALGDVSGLAAIAGSGSYADLGSVPAKLTSLAGLSGAADKGVYLSGTNTFQTYDLGSFGRSWGGLLDAAAAKVVLAITQGDVSGLSAALALLAPLANPTLTGSVNIPTATFGTSNTLAASTAFVQAAIAALINSAPGALDTLQELAAAFGNDANFAATMTTALATKLAKASNLSDLTNAGTARTNLGLVIGTHVQAFSSLLLAIAGATWAGDKLVYMSSGSAVSTCDFTAVARTFNAATTQAAQKTALGLGTGDSPSWLRAAFTGDNSVPPFTVVSNQMVDNLNAKYVGGQDAASLCKAANNLSELTDKSEARTNLELGTASLRSAADFALETHTDIAFTVSLVATFGAFGRYAMQLTADTAVSVTGYGVGKPSVTIFLYSDSSTRNVSTPSTWFWANGVKPTTLETGKIMAITVTCLSADDSLIQAAFTILEQVT